MNPVSNPLIRSINSAKFVNSFTSPNTARNAVLALVGINGTMRIIADEADKEEKPKVRHYQAFVDAMHEGFCLAVTFLVAPAFAIGGLWLGKNLLAKKSFKNINLDKIKSLKISEKLQLEKEAALKPSSPAKKVLGLFCTAIQTPMNLFKKAISGTKIGKLDNAIEKIGEYNRVVLDNLRVVLDPKNGKSLKDVIIKNDRGELFSLKPAKEVKAQIAEKLKNPNLLPDETKNLKNILKKDDFILDAIEGGKMFLSKITGKNEQELLKEGKYITNTIYKLGGNKENHNNIIGSKALGDAIGMTLAITTFSPMMTNRYVPPILKFLGLQGEEGEHGEKPGKNNIEIGSEQIKKLNTDFNNSINNSLDLLLLKAKENKQEEKPGKA